MLYTLGLYAVNVHCYITSNGFFNYLYFQDMRREKCCLFQQFKLVNSSSVNNLPNPRYESLVSKLLSPPAATKRQLFRRFVNIIFREGSRIFQMGQNCQLQLWKYHPIICQMFCWKLHWNEINRTEEDVSLVSPWIRLWYFEEYRHFCVIVLIN